ncbi:MAG TPA: hypothetical protein VK106_04690 [Balneolaceae bacterium]|nr:hypothetical protein [Balneolaceae bacterium]
MAYELDEIDNWNEKSAKLKERYTGLTDEDLEYNEGEEEDLINRLHISTGKKRDELRRELKDM